MNKQDDKIKQLFDDYASELTPREDLASKARAEMTASKQDKQPVSSRKKSIFWRHFAWIAPVFMVMIVVVSLISAPVLFPDTDPPVTQPPTMTETVTPQYYTFADVKGRSVSADSYDDVLHISSLKNEYEVVSERYYAFFTDDGELRYIKVFLGVRSADGTFTEMELIAEVDGYVREDLSYTYSACKSYNDFVSIDGYERGEYVTKGFFYARNMHFYVIARNGQRCDAVEEIISTILR